MARISKKEQNEHFISRSEKALKKFGIEYVSEMRRAGKTDIEIEDFLLSTYFELYVSLINFARLAELEELEERLIREYKNLTEK